MKVKPMYYLSFLFLFSFAYSQGNEPENKKFVFENNLSYYEDYEVDMAFVSPHYIGEEIALKFHLLDETYTTVEPATPTSPTEKTIVNKPTIYYTIKKLSRKYKREIRKDRISEEKVKENLSYVLDIGLSIFHEDTEEFEEVLRGRKKPDEIMEAFNMVVLK
jgi:hypothetical protein